MSSEKMGGQAADCVDAAGVDASADRHAAQADAVAWQNSTEINAGSFDVFAFARSGKSAQGSIDMKMLGRFVDGLPEQPLGEAGLVKWLARGEIGRSGLTHGKPLLHLRVQANPLLECQRCNALFAYPIDSEVVLQLVRFEAELDRDDLAVGGQDENPGGDQPEKVLGSHHFDLLDQVEDELILNVPYVPKHEICPGMQVPATEADQDPVVKRPSPFAVLEQLKRNN